MKRAEAISLPEAAAAKAVALPDTGPDLASKAALINEGAVAQDLLHRLYQRRRASRLAIGGDGPSTVSQALNGTPERFAIYPLAMEPQRMVMPSRRQKLPVRKAINATKRRGRSRAHGAPRTAVGRRLTGIRAIGAKTVAIARLRTKGRPSYRLLKVRPSATRITTSPTNSPEAPPKLR